MRSASRSARRGRLASVAESTPAEEERTESRTEIPFEQDVTSAGSLRFRRRFISAVSDPRKSSVGTSKRVRRIKRPCSHTSSVTAEEPETLSLPPPPKTPDDLASVSKVSFDYEASEFDFQEYEEYFEERPRSTAEDLSVQIYGRACAWLRIIPCSYFARNLTQQDMILKWQVLGVTGAKAVAIGLVTNTYVNNLVLTGNDIRDKGAMYMSEMLRENLYITSLTLSENGLKTQGLQAVCDVLKHNDCIRKLDLSGNGFQEYDAVLITEVMNMNTTIRELVLHHNCFRERGGEQIAGALATSTTLTLLDLGWNHLRLKGGVSIAEALEKNSSLEVLRVGWNGLFLEGCGAMRKALLKNDTLEELDMECNRINKECLVVLLDGVKQNATLKTLHLSNNPITPEGAKLIVTILKQTPNAGVEFIDIESQSVDQVFAADLEEIQKTRPLVVKHGCVFIHDDIGCDEDPLLDEDPMMVLMEFMRQKNMRLVDLFTSLDEDGSRSLSWDEFRDGLKTVNIPMTRQAVNKLLRKLDQDGDGEVDFSELMEGQREYKRKLMRIQKREADNDYQENEIDRIATKIRAVLAFAQVKRDKEKEKLREKEERERELKEQKDAERKEKEMAKKNKNKS